MVQAKPLSFIGLSYFTCEMSQGVGVLELQCSGCWWMFSGDLRLVMPCGWQEQSPK